MRPGRPRCVNMASAASACSVDANAMTANRPFAPHQRAQNEVGLHLLLGDDVHVGHVTDCQLVGQAVVVETGTAGQNLHTERCQVFQILERCRVSQVRRAPPL